MVNHHLATVTQPIPANHTTNIIGIKAIEIKRPTTAAATKEEPRIRKIKMIPPNKERKGLKPIHI
jgi:hypothetical protein